MNKIKSVEEHLRLARIAQDPDMANDTGRPGCRLGALALKEPAIAAANAWKGAVMALEEPVLVMAAAHKGAFWAHADREMQPGKFTYLEDAALKIVQTTALAPLAAAGTTKRAQIKACVTAFDLVADDAMVSNVPAGSRLEKTLIDCAGTVLARLSPLDPGQAKSLVTDALQSHSRRAEIMTSIGPLSGRREENASIIASLAKNAGSRFVNSLAQNLTA